MVAVAIAVIITVVLLAAGVVVQSNTPDVLSFFGVTVRTTTSQIFLTGAICTWALLAAAWLLSAGIRRSRERSAQLASVRSERTRFGNRDRNGAAVTERQSGDHPVDW